jgi:uncharacterized membrane protein
MRWFSLPPQIVRLVLVTVVIVGSYLVARYFLTPASFGELGWFRADAMWEAASYERVYAGAAACTECHSEEPEELAGGSHRLVSCESCHGPGQGHVDNPDVRKMRILTFSHCVRCHAADPSRPKWHRQIDVRDHYTGDACTECHLPHQPSEMP